MKEWYHDRDGEEPSGAGRERWLITYADLITLLMIFFIVMYSLSARISNDKFDQLASSLSNTLKKSTPKPGEKTPFTSGENPETRKFKSKAKAVMNSVVADKAVRDAVKVDIDSRGLVISLIDKSFFETGSADIRPGARPVLKKIAANLKAMPNSIRIEGHTDSIPIRTARYPTNWELSSARATSVVRFMSEQAGIPAFRLSSASYGSFKPIASNGTADGRRRNRRVDIVVERTDDISPFGAGVSLDSPKARPAKAAATPPPPPADGGFVNPFN